jgi:4-oxalocrotonate tautomerase
MPTLQLKLSPSLAPAVEAALASDLTRLTAERLGKRPEVTALMIETLPATRWFIGAQAGPGPTAWLEISITAGTNTPSQKADFIAAAHGALQHHLGGEQPLAPASYVIVRELPAGDWGYGGQTQAARQQARQLAAAPEPAQAK